MNRVIVVASHRRSGTHLTLDSIRANVKGVHPRTLTLEQVDPAHDRHVPVAEFDRRLRSLRGTVLVKTHALAHAGAWQSAEAGAYAAQLFAAWPTIYVHRDGRDVLVSLYHFVASYSPDVAAQAFGAFIRGPHSAPDVAGLTRAGYWRHHVLSWLQGDPSPTTVSYEALRDDLEPTIRSLAERLSLPLARTITQVQLPPPDAVGQRGRHRRTFPVRVVRRILGLSPRPLSTAISPRTGRSGGWREAFDAADLAYFESEAAEAMGRLGYT